MCKVGQWIEAAPLSIGASPMDRRRGVCPRDCTVLKRICGHTTWHIRVQQFAKMQKELNSHAQRERQNAVRRMSGNRLLNDRTSPRYAYGELAFRLICADPKLQ